MRMAGVSCVFRTCIVVGTWVAPLPGGDDDDDGGRRGLVGKEPEPNVLGDLGGDPILGLGGTGRLWVERMPDPVNPPPPPGPFPTTALGGLMPVILLRSAPGAMRGEREGAGG